jgi:hypothetical protein
VRHFLFFTDALSEKNFIRQRCAVQAKKAPFANLGDAL